MKGQCLWILATLALLCMPSTCVASQVEGTDLGTFVVTAYNIANEADHPCEDADEILAKGLNNYYCPEFLSDIIMQGSGVDDNNKFIQIDWSGGKKPTTASETFFTYVPYITTGSGQRLEDGISIAVDPSVIPLNSWAYIESIGWRRADDTGGAIKGKRIDVFMNVPRKDAMNFGKKNLDVVLQAGVQGKSQQESETTKEATSVTLTLYIHNGSASGSVIPGAQVIWQDGSGKSSQITADNNGIVTLNGHPGAWSFKASAENYETNSWDQDITSTCAKHAFLQKSLGGINGSTSQGASASATQAESTQPDQGSAKYWEENAYDLMNQDRWEEGLQALDKSIELNPNNPEVWRNKGVALQFLGRYEEAIQATERAIEIDPGNANAVIQRDQFVRDLEKRNKDQNNPERSTQTAQPNSQSPPLHTGLQSSESSVIGKWAFHFIRTSWESSSEKVTRGPDSKDEWDSTVEFHSDGTFTESTSYMTFAGEWTQDANNIRLQDSLEFRDGSGNYVSASQTSESRDGIIDGNTMNGRGSIHTQMTVTGDDSYSAEISEAYTWSADRIE